MKKRQFHNALRILLNIDRWDVEWMGDREWQEFIANPHRFFIASDDPTADKLWAIIIERNATSAPAAEDASATLQAEFRKCLGEISFTRAGYDVREMPPAQKSKESAKASDFMMRARQIWAENPDKRASCRGVFQDVNPLVEMREIERAP